MAENLEVFFSSNSQNKSTAMLNQKQTLCLMLLYKRHVLNLDYHVKPDLGASNHANSGEQKKVFAKEKKSTATGLVWYINMATVLLFPTPKWLL